MCKIKKNWLALLALMTVFLIAGCSGGSDQANNEASTEKVEVSTDTTAKAKIVLLLAQL